MNSLSPLTEYQECTLLVDYLSHLKTRGKIKLFTHVPNETYTTSWSQKTKNSRMGVKKGLPDYVILTPKKLLFIEMKRVKGSTVMPEQKEWIEGLTDVGITSAVCKGFDSAKLFLDQNI